MARPILHYVYDPLCGWCYAAEPLIQAAAAAGIPIMLHGGGLWEWPVHAPEAKRRMMRSTDGRIAELTGQVFGAAYLDGLLVDPATIWHSRPTIAAVLAADQLQNGQGLALLSAIQRAHYVDGRRVVQDQVLTDVAGSIGLDATAFATALQDVAVDQHIQQTRGRMDTYDLHGFPAFLLQNNESTARLPHEMLYGRPDRFVALLAQTAGAAKDAPGGAAIEVVAPSPIDDGLRRRRQASPSHVSHAPVR